MSGRVDRRAFVAASSAAAALALFPSRHSFAAAPPAEILETKVISQNAALYNGWPTVCRRANGQLVVTCSGGRESHVCPFGRVEPSTIATAACWKRPRERCW
jgi:sialidase-1